MVFKKKQAAVDEQIAEIDKLNAVINAAERDMLKLRKVYRPRCCNTLSEKKRRFALIACCTWCICNLHIWPCT